MRRTVLVLTSTLFLACAGIWVGAIFAVGALTEPQVFRHVVDPQPGVLMGSIFRRLNVVSIGLLAVMLAIAILDAGYRKRSGDRLWTLIRTVLVVASLALTLYMQLWMMPQLDRLRSAENTAAFDTMHQSYEGLAQFLAILGIASIGATSALNVGKRRKPQPQEAPVGPGVP